MNPATLPPVTHPAHDTTCEHAPGCIGDAGCFHGEAKLPVEWAIRFKHKHAPWLAIEWRHPRSDTIHRNAEGVLTDKPPKWATDR